MKVPKIVRNTEIKPEEFAVSGSKWSNREFVVNGDVIDWKLGMRSRCKIEDV